ncbi:HNH endonuclease [Vibrio phage 219E48-1]|nr:hypothetical protein PODOV021v1_p0028 [Vibrio phage 219E41.2]QZI91015.1 hypothetical protein PODOV032v1_p0010 [Vibrio phage 219E41.1]
MSNYTGNIYTTNSSGKLVITKYVHCKNVEVRFVNTGFETTARMDNIRLGRVKDPLYPSVFGVGFIGVGEYKVSVNSKITKAYQCWSDMLKRCYSEEYQLNKPTYIGCSVHPDWHNFQAFAKWYDKNHPIDGSKYELDKDILVEGNKVYGPETCMFVTGAENMIKAHAKSYAFVSPKGIRTEIYNLNEFCRDKDLNQGAMCQVSNGKAKQHKGWRLA